MENLWKEFSFHLLLLDTYASTLKNTIMAKIVIFAFLSIFGNKVLTLVQQYDNCKQYQTFLKVSMISLGTNEMTNGHRIFF